MPIVWLATQQEMMIRQHLNTGFLILISILYLGVFQTNGQENYIPIEGEISYITGQSIYVKFANTQGIENSDTLFVQKENERKPVLLVKHHSSISCLCNAIGNFKFKVGERVFGKLRAEKRQNIVTVSQEQTKIEQDVSAQVLTSAEKKEPELKGKVTGRLSLSSYSNFSSLSDENVQRFRYTLSFLGQNISGSKLSAETYISFSHKKNEWDVIQESLNNALKVYSLALRYDFDESTSLWAGRKINPKIANIGAVDGLQFQKTWSDFYVGAVVGTRPDYMDYGFNSDLLEYGGYVGHLSKSKNGFAQSSLAFFEQQNNGNTDRRFMYFQHTNTLLKNLTVFSSFEIDLFEKINDEAKSTISLTGLYFSLRYRANRKLSLFGSYDNRKNVIYYETFRNLTDEILQRASRQGFRARITYRPINYLNLGINAGTRFRDGDPRRTNTLRGYATYTRLPGINASLSLSGNFMQTSYLNGQVYGARLSKDFLNGKLYSTLNYRWVKFDYINTVSQLTQHISEIDFAYRYNKKLYLSVNFEATFQEESTYKRLYLNLRRKF